MDAAMTSLPNPDDELRQQVKYVVNSRPYYICKRSDNHKDLKSQIGSMTGEYTRREDRINEEYLVDVFTKLIKLEKQALLDCLQAGVPEKIQAAKGTADYQVHLGFNAAIDKFNATIEDVRKGL
jgi:hypothetical protein